MPTHTRLARRRKSREKQGERSAASESAQFVDLTTALIRSVKPISIHRFPSCKSECSMFDKRTEGKMIDKQSVAKRRKDAYRRGDRVTRTIYSRTVARQRGIEWALSSIIDAHRSFAPSARARLEGRRYSVGSDHGDHWSRHARRLGVLDFHPEPAPPPRKQQATEIRACQMVQTVGRRCSSPPPPPHANPDPLS
jgi:hypothetical protein